jgi:SAM-dependent methyltransferase
MCDVNCVYFALENLTKEEVAGRTVLEVGSRDVTGSLRRLIENWRPSKYVGSDIESGLGVDVICPAEKIAERFGSNSFDLVLSTELLEHVLDWRTVISNIKQVCKPNGIILVTTRSRGFPYHGYPNDFWRYEERDMKTIFADCEILALEKDSSESSPGVFVKVRKPLDFVEIDLRNHRLHRVRRPTRIMRFARDIFQRHYA